MKILIFNGSLERRSSSTSGNLIAFLKQALEDKGIEIMEFQLAEASIPLFDVTLKNTPLAVQGMVQQFRDADAHIWLSPLYHGGMTGVMKNCLDWLEVSAKETTPYLTGKFIGLVCWASGGYAIQGIQSMDNVARSLRAWTLPYFVPFVRDEIYDGKDTLSKVSQQKINLLIQILLEAVQQRNKC